MSNGLRRASIAEDAAECEIVTADDGLALRLYALGGSGPALLWGHANGFAAGSYLPFLQSLTDSFRVFAFDARGHGGSAEPDGDLVRTAHVDRFAADIAALWRTVRRQIGDGVPLYWGSHSFSGVAMLRLAGVFGECPWAGAVVMEPPMTPTPDDPVHEMATELSHGLIALADRRRSLWPSPQAYVDSLAPRKAFAAWRRDMLEAHCHASLSPLQDGTWRLACAPMVEREIYRTVLNSSTFRALPDVSLPVHFVGADPAPPGGVPSWAALVQDQTAARLPGARLTRLPETGHMMPFERPDECANLLRGMLKEPL